MTPEAYIIRNNINKDRYTLSVEDIKRICKEIRNSTIDECIKEAKIYNEGYWNEGESYPYYKLDEDSLLKLKV